MTTKKVAQYSGAHAGVGICAAALLLALLLLAERYVALRGVDTDLFPRWYGLRALLFDGRDPYTAAVTGEIVAQTSLASAPDVARAAYGFVYPLPGALLLAPLALLPYIWAGALWLTLGLVALPASLVLAVRAFAGRPDRSAERLAVALAFVTAPALWNLALVQPGLVVVPLMACAPWLWQRFPEAAGVALACAALLKPQLAAPLAGAWAVFALLRWRQPRARRLLAGLSITALALAALAALLHRAWPQSWLSALGDYAQVPAMEPLSSAVYRLARELPAGAGETPVRIVAAVTAIALGIWVVRGWTGLTTLPARGITRTIVAGALLVPPAWETNALVLLIPLTEALARLRGTARVWLVIASAALSLALGPLAVVMPWRSGALTIGASVLLWASATWWADRSAAAAGAA